MGESKHPSFRLVALGIWHIKCYQQPDDTTSHAIDQYPDERIYCF